MPINNFLLPGAKVTPAYEVANSCRFNAADSAYMTRTFGSAGNRRTWTFSTWCKRAKFGAQQTLFGSSADGSNYHLFYWGSDETLTHNFSGTTTSASGKFRDPSAWYHVVCAVDTTQSTAANRVKLYVNGVSVGSGSYPAEDAEMILNNNVRCDVGSSGAHFTSHMLGGYLAETVFIDGTQYAASDFGEFDEDSPNIWKPKDVSGLTFGTNGFYFDYEDSANLGNDANGGTDWTETNLAAADQMTDTPTLNYATWNPLSVATSAQPAFSQGNLQVITPVSGTGWSISTIGATSGKWYLEIYVVAYASLDRTAIGITGDISGSLAGNTNIGLLTNSLDVGYWQNGYSAVGNSTDTDYGDTFAVDDLMGIALNIDDNEVIFYKNNTAQNSGTAISFTAGSTYHFCLNDGSNGGGNTTVANFGQDGTFAGNKTAQGNADGAGYGDFFYTPPTGFYALNTKNLAEYG